MSNQFTIYFTAENGTVYLVGSGENESLVTQDGDDIVIDFKLRKNLSIIRTKQNISIHKTNKNLSISNKKLNIKL